MTLWYPEHSLRFTFYLLESEDLLSLQYHKAPVIVIQQLLQSYELWWLYCFDNFKVLASMLWILIRWYVAISFYRELSSIQHIVWYLVPNSFRSLSTNDEFRINFDAKRGFKLIFF